VDFTLTKSHSRKNVNPRGIYVDATLLRWWIEPLGFSKRSGNGELSQALVQTFPARSWLPKTHGGF